MHSLQHECSWCLVGDLGRRPCVSIRVWPLPLSYFLDGGLIFFAMIKTIPLFLKLQHSFFHSFVLPFLRTCHVLALFWALGNTVRIQTDQGGGEVS